MKEVSPSRVLAVVPAATVKQLCDFCQLADDTQVPVPAVAPQPIDADPPQPQNNADIVADLLAEIKKLKPRL